MKKIIGLFSIFLLFVLCLMPISNAYTSHPLDEIQSFDIYVHVRDDATIDFRYDIKWKVLDSSSEGAVDWIYVGIPNTHCDKDSIKVLSSDIYEASYYKHNYTDPSIRCDLKRKFYEGEIIDISFSFHQTHMFTFYKNDENIVTYEYIPGWFDDIEVDRLTIHWEKDGVIYETSNDALETDEYYIWQTHLDQGKHTSAQVSYEREYFPNINPKDTFKDAKDHTAQRIFMWVIIGIILCFMAASTISRIFRKPSYYRTRGFYPYGRRLFYRNYYYGVDDRGTRKTNPYTYTSSGSGGHGHSGHSCACACACACAGGGRAGCSKKDFYKGKIKIEDLIEKID